jgi:predicted transposase YbfD/YdcC
MTLAQKTADGKSNEIPAMRELLKIMDISGNMVVADALHCQKETAEAIIEGKGDYLLDVKDNQPALKEGIAEYVQDEVLRAAMDSHSVREKNNGRVERRSAYTTRDVTWLNERGEWERLACIGVIHTQCTTKKGTSDEWHYYISSRGLTAKELPRHARLEWTVETMHWLLDVRFGGDFCRIEDKNVRQNLNMARKIVLNTLRDYKNKTASKRPFSKLMLDCLPDPQHILSFLAVNEN